VLNLSAFPGYGDYCLPLASTKQTPLERDGNIHTGGFHMNEKSVFSSGQLVKFTGTMTEQGVRTTGFQHGFSSGLFSDVAECLAQEQPVKIDRNALRQVLGLDPLLFRFKVDYSLSLGQMFSDADFSVVSPTVIETNFKVNGTGIVEYEAELLALDFSNMEGKAAPEYLTGIITKTLAKQVGQDGYKFARIEHLIAFSQNYQQLNRKCPVVALGATAMIGDKMVACIHEHQLGRGGVSIAFHRLSRVLLYECCFKTLLIREVKE
jgi:hypothetical protein